MEPKSEFQKIRELEIETIQAISKGQQKKVLTLFGKAEHLFKKGSNYTRSIISKKFILPISQLFETNYDWGKGYLNLLSQQLKRSIVDKFIYQEFKIIYPLWQYY